MKKEVWKQVKGFPGYKVSDQGRVKNKSGKVIKPMEHTGKAYKYLYVCLYNSGKRKYFSVHRLVALHFLVEIHHVDLDPRNNGADNLILVSKERHEIIHSTT